MSAIDREVLLEEGVVLRRDEAAAGEPARVRVRLVAGDHCEGCPASALCKPGEGDRRVLDVIDTIGVECGDRVRVAVPGGAVLRASFLIYGLPLILLVAGVLLGQKLWPGHALGDLWSFLLGTVLAGLAVPLVARMARDTEASGGALLEPRITEKLVDLEAVVSGS